MSWTRVYANLFERRPCGERQQRAVDLRGKALSTSVAAPASTSPTTDPMDRHQASWVAQIGVPTPHRCVGLGARVALVLTPK